MPLNKQTYHFPFAGGVDKKTSSKHVRPAKLLGLQDGVFEEPGQIEKRPGWTDMGLNTTSQDDSSNYEIIDQAYGAAVVRDELLMCARQRDGADNSKTYYKDGPKLFSYADSQDRWSDVGEMSAYKWSFQDMTRSGYRFNADVAVSGNYIVVANSLYDGSNYHLNVVITDKATGATIHDITESTNGPYLLTPVRVVACGSIVGIFYADSVSQDFYYGVFDANAPDVAPTFSRLFIIGTTSFDVYSDGTLFFIALNTATGGNSLKVQTYNVNFSFQNLITVMTTSLPGKICIESTGDSGVGDVIVSFGRGTEISVVVLDDDMTHATGYSSFVDVYDVGASYIITTTSIMFDPGSWNPTTASWRIWFSAYHTSTGIQCGSVRSATSNGAIVGSAYIFSHTKYQSYPYMAIASKCFVGAGGRVSVLARFFSIYQPCYFILSMHEHDGSETVEADAKLLAGRTSHLSIFISSVATNGSDLYIAGILADIERVDIGNIWSIGYFKINYDTGAHVGNAVSDKDISFGAGVIHQYDGDAAELGFHLYPEEIPTVVKANTGGNLADGTYNYKTTYEWYDRYGQVHRSAPSLAEEVVHAAATDANKTTITIMRSSMIDTKKLENCKVVLYRTEESGTTYYRVDDAYLTKTGTTLITIVDTTIDSSLIGGELLYTTGNVLENDAPPASNVLAMSGNRLWVAPYDDVGLLWHSKIKAVNTGFEFNAALTVRHDVGGAITAIADMDGKLIIFKRTSIYYLYGQGPNALGQGVFSPVQSISVDVGCVDQRSVVAYSRGIVFKSEKGIKLLDRSMQIADIGVPVDDYDSSDVKSASLLEQKNQLRFGLSTGECLMFDYLVNQWSVFTNHTNIIDAVLYSKGYVWLSSDAIAHQEDNTGTDESTAIGLVVDTAWIRIAQLQGVQRVYFIELLGEYTGTGNIVIDIYYNDSETKTDRITQSMSAASPWSVRFRPSQSKSDSIRLKITGAYFKLAGMSLEVGAKKGLRHLGAANTLAHD
ncbi:MAG: hypothetical protein GY923_15240 [Aestuariibacter sp.]|nr:hypothetical protein [Aestuariibacter sp.]